MKNTKGQTSSEPDVGMRLTAKISNVWTLTRIILTLPLFQVGQLSVGWRKYVQLNSISSQCAHGKSTLA